MTRNIKLAATLQEELETSSGLKVELKINDNHSTMLSVKWMPDRAKVSLHRMFLGAPRNVMEALSCYLRGKSRGLAPTIKAYIETNIRELNYSSHLDLNRLETKGKIYDLEEIYNDINKEYFGNELDLHITWFGKKPTKPKKQLTLGLYHDPLKLIKIHRMLDNPKFPDFLVSYVIYHEMLHEACPAYIDERGIKQIHSRAFKLREKEFHAYKRSQEWMKNNQKLLFGGLVA